MSFLFMNSSSNPFDRDSYSYRLQLHSAQSALETQGTIHLIQAKKEEDEHKARMAKARDLELQVLAAEELKRKADEEAALLKNLAEEIEKKIADDLAEHEEKMDELDIVHDSIIEEQTQQLKELKEKTDDQKKFIEMSKEGLNKVVDYVESFTDIVSGI